MNKLALDWLWLYLQIIVLVAVIARELIRPHKRNLYAILIPGVMLVLVQGQAWWMLSKFTHSDMANMRHLRQTISLDGARLANFYVGLSVICFVVTYAFFAPRGRSAAAPAPVKTRYYNPRLASNLLAAVWVLVSGAILLHLAGGLNALMTRPGQAMAGGVTMFLMMTMLGKLPLFHKVAFLRRINLFDLALFTLVLFLFLVNSRFLAAFILLQLAVLLNYCWREVSRRGLLGLVLVMFLIFIVFGLYRDYTAYFNGVKWVTLQKFFMTHMRGNDSLEWFYRVNVEGFAGLAGILTFAADNGGIAHDFGLSNLGVITKFIPYAIRNDPAMPFMDIANALESLYPYHGSLIPSGMESAYAHFGLPGILGFGALLGYLTRWLHAKMSNPMADRVLIALLSICALHLIRGLFGGTFLLGSVEVIMLWVYRSMRVMDLKPSGSGL
jgi:hypothetical protein